MQSNLHAFIWQSFAVQTISPPLGRRTTNVLLLGG